MKKSKMLSGFLAALTTAFVFCAAALAAGPATPVGTQVQMQAQPIKLPVDLLIQYIEYYHCPCTLNQTLNAEYITDTIAVKVANTSRDHAAKAKVTVQYYNIALRSMVSSFKIVTLNPNQWTKVIMVQSPLLIGKSQGVSAVIEHEGASFFDPNPANNRMVQKTCGEMVE